MTAEQAHLLAVVGITPPGRGQILAVHNDEPDLPLHERSAPRHAAAVDCVIVALPIVADFRKGSR